MPDDNNPNAPLMPKNNPPTMAVSRHLVSVLSELENGKFLQDCSGEFLDMCAELEDMSGAKARQAVNGKFTLTIEVVAQEGTLQIRPEYVTKVPKRPRGMNIFWRGRDGSMTRTDPGQLELGLRVVGTSNEAPPRIVGG